MGAQNGQSIKTVTATVKMIEKYEFLAETVIASQKTNAGHATVIYRGVRWWEWIAGCFLFTKWGRKKNPFICKTVLYKCN